MTIKETTCYNVICDTCHVERDTDNGDYVEKYSSLGHAVDAAESDDWLIVDGKHACPECRDKEDDGETP